MAGKPSIDLPEETDFLDFGCSDGRSILLGQTLFAGGKGVGVDVSADKVKAAQAAGFDAIEADITKLDGLENAVRFVIANHFLEHLPGFQLAKRCLHSAVRVAREFVFIKQPWFDSDGYLLQHGLKQYWSDWRGHPNHMTTLDFVNILAPMHGGRIERFAVYGIGPVKGSGDFSIHPVHSPVDSQRYDPQFHSPKPKIIFDQPVFREVAALIRLHGSSDSFEVLEEKFQWAERIFDSKTIDEHKAGLPKLPWQWTGEAPLSIGGTIGASALCDGAHEIESVGTDPQILLPEFKLGAAEGITLSFDLEAPRATEAQLYYGTEAERSFSPRLVETIPIPEGRSQQSITVKRQDLVGLFRFDPGTAPGTYRIHALSITEAD